MNLIKIPYEINPFLIYMKIKNKYTMLIESTIRVSDTGDNSIIFFNPKNIIKYKDGCIYEDGKIIRGDILDLLDEKIKSKKPLGTGLIFDGGFAGYLTYDYGMELMNVKRKNNSSFDIPDILFAYYEDFIVVDHREGCTYLCTYDKELIQSIEDIKGEYVGQDVNVSNLNSNFTHEYYIRAVEDVREYVRKGDVYQVNISQQFSGDGEVNPYDVYAKFRKANFGPYNAFLDIDNRYILSTSPEQFIRKRGEYITTRPIKGTIKRSLDIQENEILKKELLSSEKDRAELLMIIDLERNDLSKICVPGTVEVTSLYDVEEYSTVNHLVSTVNGKLMPNCTFGDIIRAMFPGGSITGAPKLRSMEVIEELETSSRSIYTGSIGYISNNGNMDFNIAIRTPVIEGNRVYYNVGGGITWDSNPQAEFLETLYKGRAINKSLTGKDELNEY